MKGIYILLVMIVAGCNGSNNQDNKRDKKDTAIIKDTVIEKTKPILDTAKPELAESNSPLPGKVYSNERFKEVTVRKTGDNKFVVKGKAQIFEAQFGWVVEDGHEELKQGSAMTDAGAPEWGNFSFTVDVPKKRANSTLHLILFESSAKDGSRQYELPVLLY